MAKVNTTTNKVTFESDDNIQLDALRSVASGLVAGDNILLEKGSGATGSSAMKIPVENFAAYAGKKITQEANAEALALVETFQKAEDERIAAETQRQQNETERQSNETARQTAETNRETAESARTKAETARADAETARTSAEDARKTAEEARATAEQTRQTAETQRTEAETSRQTAEEARATAEAARQKAETARVTAESDRATAESQRETDSAVAVKNAENATAAANTAAQKANTATEAANTATQAAKDATEETKEEAAAAHVIVADLFPDSLSVEYPEKITLGNTTGRYINAVLSPENTPQNIIYLGDNVAVNVSPNGLVTPVAVGVSTIHVIPTLKTSLYQTIRIEVAAPSIRMVKGRTSMRLTGSGGIRKY